MDDNEKWLEAAEGLEQDIVYLENALRAANARMALELLSDIARLKLAVSIYKENAAAGVRWPSPDDLFCIVPNRHRRVHTQMRRDFKLAS